jgi:hypothetical protein
VNLLSLAIWHLTWPNKKNIQNGLNIQDGDFTFPHQFALYFHPFQTYKLQYNISKKYWYACWFVTWWYCPISGETILKLHIKELAQMFHRFFLGWEWFSTTQQHFNKLIELSKKKNLFIHILFTKSFKNRFVCITLCFRFFKVFFFVFSKRMITYCMT